MTQMTKAVKHLNRANEIYQGIRNHGGTFGMGYPNEFVNLRVGLEPDSRENMNAKLQLQVTVQLQDYEKPERVDMGEFGVFWKSKTVDDSCIYGKIIAIQAKDSYSARFHDLPSSASSVKKWLQDNNSPDDDEIVGNLLSENVKINHLIGTQVKLRYTDFVKRVNGVTIHLDSLHSFETLTYRILSRDRILYPYSVFYPVNSDWEQMWRKSQKASKVANLTKKMQFREVAHFPRHTQSSSRHTASTSRSTDESLPWQFQSDTATHKWHFQKHSKSSVDEGTIVPFQKGT